MRFLYCFSNDNLKRFVANYSKRSKRFRSAGVDIIEYFFPNFDFSNGS